MTKFDLKSRDYLNTPERKQIFNRYLFSAIAPEYGAMSKVLSRFPNRSELHEKFAAHGLEIIRSNRHFFGITETIIATKRNE